MKLLAIPFKSISQSKKGLTYLSQICLSDDLSQQSNLNKKSITSSYRQINYQGFTLLEMLVVLVIIGLLAGLVGPRLFSKVDTAKIDTASTQIKLLKGAIETMRLDINVYPSESEGLDLLVKAPSDPALAKRWRGPYLEENVPLDPWGNKYIYKKSENLTRPFAIISYGADGKPGGSGNDQDLGIPKEDEPNQAAKM